MPPTTEQNPNHRNGDLIASELVSVIVPTRNSAQHLQACLESIVAQTYKAIELIIVDNYSTDETEAIARQFTTNVFRYGPERSAQVNMGARVATGQVIYKVDSDFILEPDVVTSGVAELAKGFDAVVVHNSPDVSVGWIARIRKFEVDMYKYDLTHSSARFVRSSAFDAIGGFDEDITAGEDYDFQNRLTRAGFRTGFITPEATHLGEPRSFWSHMVKYYRYGVDAVIFAERNAGMASRQLGPLRSVYLRNWRRFTMHPIRGTAFLVYAVSKFAFGGVGFTVGTVRRKWVNFPFAGYWK